MPYGFVPGTRLSVSRVSWSFNQDNSPIRQGLLLRAHFTVNKTAAEDVTVIGSPRGFRRGTGHYGLGHAGIPS